MKVVAAGAAVVVAAVLGYGAWGAHTHADVWLQVKDHAGRSPKQLWSNVTDGRITIRDPAGRTIAEAVIEPPHGLPRWTGPPGQALRCEPQLRPDAWRSCLDAQSRWMARWVPQAHDARVSVAGCSVDRVAVLRRNYSDWWFWWVPLPHVGGTPGAHYTLELHLDSARCAPARPPTDP